MDNKDMEKVKLSNENYTPYEYYQPLFDLMSKEHDLTLVQGEMDEILTTCRKMDKTFTMEQVEKAIELARRRTHRGMMMPDSDAFTPEQIIELCKTQK